MSRRLRRPALLLACLLCARPAPAPAQPEPAAPGAPPVEAAPAAAPNLAAELGRLQGQRVRLVDLGPGAGSSPGPGPGPGPGPRVDPSHAPGPGHTAGYVIEDVAGEGAPVVGVVEQRPDGLWLASEDGARYRLAGVLARPRIAGPGYKIWVLGAVIVQQGENVLVARRLGVLAPPWQRAQARAARSTIFAISAGAPTRTGVLAPPWQRAQARAARSTIFAISAGAPTRTGGPQ
jgi:hypothetical protein